MVSLVVSSSPRLVLLAALYSTLWFQIVQGNLSDGRPQAPIDESIDTTNTTDYLEPTETPDNVSERSSTGEGEVSAELLQGTDGTGDVDPRRGGEESSLNNISVSASVNAYHSYNWINQRNCYNGNGGVDIDNDWTAVRTSYEGCYWRCSSDYSCDCVVYRYNDGMCWKRRYCYIPNCGGPHSYDSAVYVVRGGRRLDDPSNNTDKGHTELSTRQDTNDSDYEVESIPGEETISEGERSVGLIEARAGATDDGPTSGNDGVTSLDNVSVSVAVNDYRSYSWINQRNCYNGNGGVDIDNDWTAVRTSYEGCYWRCRSDYSCDCVVYRYNDGMCWKRRYCYIPNCGGPHSYDSAVYVVRGGRRLNDPSNITDDVHTGQFATKDANDFDDVATSDPAEESSISEGERSVGLAQEGSGDVTDDKLSDENVGNTSLDNVSVSVAVVDYRSYNWINQRNCYNGNGGVDIDNDWTAVRTSYEGCYWRCRSDYSCDCVVYRYNDGMCWKRRYCYIPNCGGPYSHDSAVYVVRGGRRLGDDLGNMIEDIDATQSVKQIDAGLSLQFDGSSRRLRGSMPKIV